MNFAQDQRKPARHMIGITAVILVHVVLVWALLNGLAQKVIEVVKAPLQVKVIEEQVKKVEPPPPPPPPKLAPPPPPFIPPPEVNVAVPPPTTAVITTVTHEAPPAPTLPREPPPAPPAPAPAPAVMAVGVVCPNWPSVKSSIVYPARAAQDGIEGDVAVEMLLAADGSVKEVAVKKTPSRDFIRPVTQAIQSMVKCNPLGHEQRVSATVTFKLD